MFKCNICSKEINERERCNPEPLLPFEKSVCHDCDTYVTASRMHLVNFNTESFGIVASTVLEILQLSHALRNGRAELFKKMEEE
tara:strand:- start:2085 stop:2336 length:252 start_codon:yes stop_codon:yes gene_type:complete